MDVAIKIVEVGPRDGLQNEPTFVPTDTKLSLIEKLIQSGLKTIEATSFVSPEWVPQLADASAVMAGLPGDTDVDFPVLVPNLEGFEKAVSAGARHVAVFAAASETFSQKNINCSIDESLQRFKDVLTAAKAHNIPVRGYISCVLGCPYEGAVPLKNVTQLTEALFAMGCHEISLGDTIGVGTAAQVKALIKAAATTLPLSQLAVHFHNTYGQALVNIYTALQEGIRIVDAAVAGLGGCPYAKGATGNVATEDVVYLLNGLGCHTGVDLNRLCEAGDYICNALNQVTRSRVARALSAKETQ